MQGVSEDQQRARVFGVLFLITYVTSIGALALFQSVLDDPAGYIAGDGKDSQIYLGAFLELLLDHRERRNGRRALPDREATERAARDRLRRCSNHRVRLHRGRDHPRARRRQPAPGLSGRGRPRRLARRAQGLDVPVRPRDDRPLRERADPRLPDVQVRPRPAMDALARTDRRAAAPDREHRRALRLVGSDRRGQPSWSIPEFLWELFLGIYAAVWGFRKDAPILAARSS